MIFLNKTDLSNLLRMEDAIRVLETCFRLESKGKAITPQRTNFKLRQPEGHMLLMPSQLIGDQQTGALGVKLYTELKKEDGGISPAHAIVVLFDTETGQPCALIEGMYLTGLRTGAVSSIAAKHLARDDLKVLGIIGAGYQGFFQVRGISAISTLEKVLICDKSRKAKLNFKERVEGELELEVTTVDTTDQILEVADVVITATSSVTPVFSGENLKAGTTIIAIGSFKPDSRELDTQTIQKSRIFVDSYDAALAEAGDLVIPMENGYLSKNEIAGELEELVTGTVRGRKSNEEINIFKAVGLAMEDICLSKLAYQKAVRENIGIHCEFVSGLDCVD